MGITEIMLTIIGVLFGIFVILVVCLAGLITVGKLIHVIIEFLDDEGYIQSLKKFLRRDND